jgi:outer membrane protein assembly factor BamB
MFRLAVSAAALIWSCPCFEAAAQVTTPAEIRLTSEWTVAVTVPGNPPVAAELQIPGPDVVTVTGEKHDRLPDFNARTAGWKKGARLRGVIAAECTVEGSLDPVSLMVRAGPEPAAQTFEKGVDYEADLLNGTVGRLPQGAIGPRFLVALLIAVCGGSTSRADEAVDALSEQLEQTPALVVVVVGSGEAGKAAVRDIVARTPWSVFCRGAASPEMEQIRDWARAQGLLGGRVCVAIDDSRSLWLADDLADAVWVAPGVADPPAEQEILRVLHPGGVGLLAGKTLVKPAPAGVDQWRHPYHGANNNVVSDDRLAALPGELRFQTFPVFAAMPNQTLFAGGRIFFFSGHIAFHQREEPLLNRLTVLNAYNGLPQWTRPLDPNYVVHNVAKLATEREVLFAEGASLWMLDAKTGDELGRFNPPPEAVAAGATEWKWIVQQDDTLWAALGPPDARVTPHRARREMGHWPWDVANRHYEPIVQNFGAATVLAAFEYPEMKLRWHVAEQQPFDVRALCLDNNRLLQLAPQHYLAAVDAATGREIWRREADQAGTLFDAIGQALRRQGWGIGWATYCYARASDGVIVLAGPQLKSTVAISFDTGDLLWSLPVQSPHPFFYGDQLYIMPRVAAPAAVCQRVEPRTGRVIEQFSLGVIGSCTRVTVTPSQFFYRPGGGEGRTVYVDLAERRLADYEGVVRPGCFDGVVPANGRLYWMPLACDCWQVHGTFCMAPRKAVTTDAPPSPAAWLPPSLDTPAAAEDWPMYRTDPAGRACVPAKVPRAIELRWQRKLVAANRSLPEDAGRIDRAAAELTAPVCAAGRVYVACADGTVSALDIADGQLAWQAASGASVVAPPAYWQGRVAFGSCDGSLYCLDASDGRELGRLELAPTKRFVNIMNRFMSAWPLGGGVVVDDQGIAYTAAGSTAADGCIAAAVDLRTGTLRWRQAYTPDRTDPSLSFGVQSNLLLADDRLLINGGAPVGVVGLAAATGADPNVVAKLEAGMEMFLEPDGRPSCTGPELFSHGRTRTTIFKRHQGRLYFPLADRHVALIDGRLFCARSTSVLDRIVQWMNEIQNLQPRNVLQVPADDAVLWASETADVRGLAVGADGLVVLHETGIEAVSPAGERLWNMPLPCPPVRWGIALTGDGCIVTLTDGQVVCLGEPAITD